MRKLFLLISLLLFLYGCSKKIKIYNLQNEKCVYDDSRKEIIYSGAGVGHIGDKIFVLDRDGWDIKILNREFNLIGKISLSKGQGPGELQRISGMGVKDGYIYIMGLSKVVKYSPEGRFIKEFKFKKIVFPFQTITDGDCVYSLNFIGGKGFPFDPNKMFLKTSLRSNRSVPFGRIDADDIEYLKNRDELTLFNFGVNGNYFVANNMKMPFVYIYRRDDLKLLKKIEVDIEGNFLLGKPFFDTRGNLYFFVYYKNEGKLILYTYDREFNLVGIERSQLNTFPRYPIFINGKTILFLDKDCEKLYKTSLNSHLLISERFYSSLSEMINEDIEGMGYGAREVGCGYIDFLKDSGAKKFFLESFSSSVSLFYFDGKIALFNISVKYPEVLRYDIGRGKFSLFKPEDNFFLDASYFEFLDTGNSTFGIEGKVNKGGFYYKLRVYDFNYKRVSDIILGGGGNRAFLNYSFSKGTGVVENHQSNSYELYTKDKFIPLVPFSYIRERLLTDEKYLDCTPVFVKSGIFLLFPEKYFFMFFSTSGEKLNEGELNFLKGKYEIAFVNRCKDDDLLFLTKKRFKDGVGVALFRYNPLNDGVKNLLNFSLPFDFSGSVDEDANLLLYFPDKLDCFLVIKRKDK